VRTGPKLECTPADPGPRRPEQNFRTRGTNTISLQIKQSGGATEFVHPRLSPEEEERYYQEMALVARIFGTPASVIPGSLGEFREYFRVEIESGAIWVTRPAREVAAVILEAPLPAPLRLLAPAHRLSTAGLLPPKLREDYGLRWTPLHELALPLAARTPHLSAAPLLRMASKLAPPARTLTA
jgi:uncharacterized protein (DUF2236 family)